MLPLSFITYGAQPLPWFASEEDLNFPFPCGVCFFWLEQLLSELASIKKIAHTLKIYKVNEKPLKIKVLELYMNDEIRHSKIIHHYSKYENQPHK